MTDEAQIITGSFKDVSIAINSGGVEGGRKTAVKQFPSRDTQTVEDLGLMPRRYTLEIIISDKIIDKKKQDYFEYRNSLLAALESKGPGELIHPLYGRIENVVAVSFSLNETFGSFGDTTVTVNFEINDNTGIPQSSGNVITQVAKKNDIVQAAVAADIAENFKVTESFAGNFAAAVDKVNGIIDQARESTAFIGEAAQTLNQFSAQLGGLAANVNGLVSDPLALGQAFTGLMQSVNGLFASANATFDTFTGFFGFGDDGLAIKQDTAGRVERQNNNGALNGAVSGSSLGFAFLSATAIDFETTQEIDELTAQLDDQYEAVKEGGSSQEVVDAVTDMRVKVFEALDQVRVDTSQIVTVETTPTTSRLLAFSYYGDDTQGETITDLNGFADVSFVEGPVEVLTI